MATKKAAAPTEPKKNKSAATDTVEEKKPAAAKAKAAPKKTVKADTAPAETKVKAEEVEAETADVREEKVKVDETEKRTEAEKKVFAESEATARRKSRSAISSFARTQESVLTVDGEERVSDAVREFSDALIELSMSKSNGILLRDKIDSIERRRGDGNYAAVCYHGPFKVYIPADKLIQGKLDPLPNATLAQTYGYVMQSYMGAEIEYVCKEVVTEDGAKIAMGDHVEACKTYQKRFFIDKERISGLPRVRAGRIVEARVISVRKYGVRLNIFGFEKFVPTSQLTYNRLEYANKEFEVDDIIEVKIVNVDIAKNEKGVEEVKNVDISVKELKSNPLKKALEMCQPGAFYTGEVDMIDEKAVFVSVTFGDVKATCYCPYHFGVRNGSKVTLRVKDVDLSTLRIWGNIIRVTRR